MNRQTDSVRPRRIYNASTGTTNQPTKQSLTYQRTEEGGLTRTTGPKPAVRVSNRTLPFFCLRYKPDSPREGSIRGDVIGRRCSSTTHDMHDLTFNESAAMDSHVNMYSNWVEQGHPVPEHPHPVPANRGTASSYQGVEQVEQGQAVFSNRERGPLGEVRICSIHVNNGGTLFHLFHGGRGRRSMAKNWNRVPCSTLFPAPTHGVMT